MLTQYIYLWQWEYIHIKCFVNTTRGTLQAPRAQNLKSLSVEQTQNLPHECTENIRESTYFWVLQSGFNAVHSCFFGNLADVPAELSTFAWHSMWTWSQNGRRRGTGMARQQSFISLCRNGSAGTLLQSGQTKTSNHSEPCVCFKQSCLCMYNM